MGCSHGHVHWLADGQHNAYCWNLTSWLEQFSAIFTLARQIDLKSRHYCCYGLSSPTSVYPRPNWPHASQSLNCPQDKVLVGGILLTHLQVRVSSRLPASSYLLTVILFYQYLWQPMLQNLPCNAHTVDELEIPPGSVKDSVQVGNTPITLDENMLKSDIFTNLNTPRTR